MELEKEWHISEEEALLGGESWYPCYFTVPPLPFSPLLTHPGEIINNYSTSLHWMCYCPVAYESYSAELALIISVKS